MYIANTGYEIILGGFISAFIAQCLKLLFYYLANKKIDFNIFVTTGGMPSSHSSSVMSVSTSVGLIQGFDSVEFAITLAFSLLVMYDAAGIRRAAGRMASVLNRIVVDMYEHQTEKQQERLKELLGHTPIQVLAGAVLGCCVSLVMHQMLIS